jgi:hypothetical protein
MGLFMGDVKYACPEELVVAEGIEPKAKVPAPWKEKPKECFKNAALFALGSGDGFYTEGYYKSLIPIHHAWITRPDGSIFDPTIDVDRDADPANYLGIAFDTNWFRQYIDEGDGYPEVLINRFGFFNEAALRGELVKATLTA